MVEIMMRDHELGIPPDQMPLLFQRFARLPRDLTSNVIGNGLGLHLCQAFAEAMGERTWAESTGIEGEGTTFLLRLPPPVVTMVHLPTSAAQAPDGMGDASAISQPD